MQQTEVELLKVTLEQLSELVDLLAKVYIPILISGLLGVYVTMFALAGVFWKKMGEHTGNTDKHPSSTHIVYKDVCQVIQEMNANQFKNISERLDEIRDMLKGGAMNRK